VTFQRRGWDKGVRAVKVMSRWRGAVRAVWGLVMIILSSWTLLIGKKSI
jgi:hypothetical protein